MLSHQRNEVTLSKLSNTGRELNLFFKPILQLLKIKKARVLVQAIVNGFNGDDELAKNAFKDIHPSVLLQKIGTEIYDQFNRPYHDMSPLQAIFAVHDISAMRSVRIALEPLMKTREGRDELANQIVSINPSYLAGYLSRHYKSNGLLPKTIFSVKELTDVMLSCSDSEIEEFQKSANSNPVLHKSVETFKRDFAKLVSSETCHNPEHLIDALKYYQNIIATKCWGKVHLFEIVIIGYMEKFWPSIYFHLFKYDIEAFIAHHKIARSDLSHLITKIDMFGINKIYFYDRDMSGSAFSHYLNSIHDRIASYAERYFLAPLQNALRRQTLMNENQISLALISAINSGDFALFKQLVDENPQFNITQLLSENLEYKNAENILYYALENRKENIAIFLIQSNKFELEPNVAHVAAANGCKEVLKHLFTLPELNVTKPGQHGWNLLHFAASTGDFETFSLVLNTGLFDLSCLDDSGKIKLPTQTVASFKLIVSKNIEIQKREDELVKLREEVTNLKLDAKRGIINSMDDEHTKVAGSAFRK